MRPTFAPVLHLVATCAGTIVLAFLSSYLRWELLAGTGTDFVLRNAPAITLLGTGVGVLIWSSIPVRSARWSRGLRASIASAFGAAMGYAQGGIVGAIFGAPLGLVAGSIFVVAIERKKPKSLERSEEKVT